LTARDVPAPFCFAPQESRRVAQFRREVDLRFSHKMMPIMRDPKSGLPVFEHDHGNQRAATTIC
jgi:hypothetical protein